MGMTGYILLVLDMFGVGLLLAKFVEPGLSLVLLWYGLYFGILGRDLAEVASEQMVRRGDSVAAALVAAGVAGQLLSSVHRQASTHMSASCTLR